MKTLLILISFWIGLSISTASAQVVQDPLLAYYKRITAPEFDRQNDGDFQYSPQTPVYYFEAELDGPEHKAVFVTDKGNYLGERGQYAWSVYVPVKSGGYRLVTDNTNYITAGLLGPSYVGYIDQLKKYGVIVSGRDEITAYYLEDGALKTKLIDQERGHPKLKKYTKYFPEKLPDYHIATYTLAQLAQKYTGQ